MLGTYPQCGGLEAWSARGLDRVVLNAGPRRHDCPDVVAAVVLGRPASGHCDQKTTAVVDSEVVALVGLPANDDRHHAAQLPVRLRRHTPGPPGLRGTHKNARSASWPRARTPGRRRHPTATPGVGSMSWPGGIRQIVIFSLISSGGSSSPPCWRSTTSPCSATTAPPARVRPASRPEVRELRFETGDPRRPLPHPADSGRASRSSSSIVYHPVCLRQH